MNSKQTVLVTGSAGRIGRAAVRALVERGHSVRGFDLAATPGLPPECSFRGSIQDATALQAAIQGVDCVIHLAATPDDQFFPRPDPPEDRDNFEDQLLPNNLLGSYRLMEAVRKKRIPRVILASTGQVVDGHLDEGNVPVTLEHGVRPKYLYACTKVFLEALGQAYAVQHGMQVLAARLGWCPRDAVQVAQLQAQIEDQDVYLSPGDAGRFFAAAVEAVALPPFAVVFATSRPLRRLLYDLEPARRILGFEPADAWPCGAEDW